MNLKKKEKIKKLIKGNYYFDDFIKMGGAKNDAELTNFFSKKITKGLIKMNVTSGTFGCSAFTAKTKDPGC